MTPLDQEMQFWGKSFLDNWIHLLERWSKNLDVEFPVHQLMLGNQYGRNAILLIVNEHALHSIACWCQTYHLESFSTWVFFCCCSWVWPFLSHWSFQWYRALIIWSFWWQRSMHILCEDPGKPFLVSFWHSITGHFGFCHLVDATPMLKEFLKKDSFGRRICGIKKFVFFQFFPNRLPINSTLNVFIKLEIRIKFFSF